MLSKAGHDNRKYPRAVFKRSIKYKTTSVEAFSGQLSHDISQGGIRINSNDFVPLNSSLTVQFQLEDLGRLFDLQGKVVWVRHLPYSDGYQVGVEFTGDASFQQWKIAQFVFNAKGNASDARLGSHSLPPMTGGVFKDVSENRPKYF
ncbi:MAG: PilZ domain-containing protein [Candidatus Omnitrophica bacterium]|nr:PilZ domain-containing protein [Candidatus Omnitrophota bacterium]